MATPLPMNRPVPIAPPRPIITSCALLKSLCRPASRLAIADASGAAVGDGDVFGIYWGPGTTAVASISTFACALHEGNDLYDAHRGEILAHHRTVRRADIRELCAIFVAARDIPGQPYDVFRAGLRLREHGANVLERLPYLVGKTLARETAMRIPADLSGDENLPAGGDDAVAVAARAGPLRGL